MDTFHYHWTVLVFCIFLIIPGVSADDAFHALIASLCVVGVLILISALICVFCYYRIKRRAEEKTLPKAYANGTLSKGMYKKQMALEHQSMRGPPPIRHISATAQRAKAYTQHAVGHKQRPPVIFYTIKSDPRNSPDAVPIGPPHPYRAAPVGRPVIFLDWIDTGRHKANGGPIIKEIDTDGSKGSKRHRSPDKAARSRSKSRSRSRDSGRRSRSRPRGDQRNPSIHHADGDVIFTTQKEDTKRYSRNTGPRSHKRSDGNNNRMSYFDNKAMVVDAPDGKQMANGGVGQLPADGGRYSVTQIHSSQPVISSIQDTELSLNFGDDLDSIPDPTPRVDYSRDEVAVQRNASINQGFVPDKVEPTPRPDYSARDTVNSREQNPIVADSIDDIIALGSTSEAADTKQITRNEDFQRSHRQNPNIARAPTPPFDGLNGGEPNSRSEGDAERRLRQLVHTTPAPPPPPAPPLPSPQTDYPDVQKANWRPPTPPPGRIQHDPNIDIDDILKLGDKPLSKPIAHYGSKSATSQAIKEGGLPFLVELLKRRPTIDAGTPRVNDDRNEDYDPTYQRIITNDDKDDDDINYRPSTVQFAQAPPQIIPRSFEDVNSPTDYNLPSTSKGPAPQPPSSSTQFNSENMVLY